jgi:predicted ester cyclase
MSPEELKHFMQRFDAMFNTPDINIADEIFTPDFRTDQPMGLTFTDLPSFKAYVQSFYVAFPDLRQETYDSILTADKFVLRVSYFGTHKGEFMGVPATGRSVVMPGTGIFRFKGTKAVENWAQYDIFRVYQQITAPAK